MIPQMCQWFLRCGTSFCLIFCGLTGITQNCTSLLLYFFLLLLSDRSCRVCTRRAECVKDGRSVARAQCLSGVWGTQCTHPGHTLLQVMQSFSRRKCTPCPVKVSANLELNSQDYICTRSRICHFQDFESSSVQTFSPNIYPALELLTAPQVV